MRYALGLVGLVVVGLVVATSSAVPRSLPRVASPAGAFDVQLGPRINVEHGGGVWVVRSWRRRARGSYPPANEDCLQVGQESGARLVRLVAGRKRTMALRDRSVCGSTAFRANEPIDPATTPLLVERLVDATPGRPMEFGNTLVAGFFRRPSGASNYPPVAVGSGSRSATARGHFLRSWLAAFGVKTWR